MIQLSSSRHILLFSLLSLGTTDVSAQSFPFVIPSDDGLPTVTSRAQLLDGPIAPDDERVRVRDGHFYRGQKRIRLWGVNLCLGSCFPSHAQAEDIAAHLAKLGVNAVRFHHLDMLDAPLGIWQAIGEDGKRHFDPEMVDRLDYFLAQLHKHGIHANLNLHVSRTLTEQEGFPVVEDLPWWAAFNKWTTYYHPAVQHEIKRYSYMLLMHRNPYREGRRRVDDAGIALIELLNENFFSRQGASLAGQLPDFYRRPLTQQWNQWLSKKYGEQSELENAWQYRHRDSSLARNNIPIPDKDWPKAAQTDLETFLVDTEIAWAKEFKQYLQDLGISVPITVSQVGFSHPRVTEEVSDYVDMHHYWHHPIFDEGKDWDPEAWTVGNDALEANPFREGWPTTSLLLRLGEREFGKPLVLSEWNYPEPSPFSVGSIPLAATLAALHDWDGVFFFDYDSQGYTDQRNSHLRDHAASFFSFNGQPLKLAAFSASANLFLRGDLAPLAEARAVATSDVNSARLGLTFRLGRQRGNEESVLEQGRPLQQLHTPDRRVIWTWSDEQQGCIQLHSPNTLAAWGAIGDHSVTLGNLKVRIEATDPNYGVFMLSSVDGLAIEESKSMVLFAASRCENTGMVWNRERNSVGKHWGHGPTLVTGLRASIEFPNASKNLRCFALSGKGERREEIPMRNEIDRFELQISPADRTIWYELVRGD